MNNYATRTESRKSKKAKKRRAAADEEYDGNGGRYSLDLMDSPILQQQAELVGYADLISDERKNNTGIPDQMKVNYENHSGFSLDDVRVHYNSDKPAQLQAHAYAQGSEIHLASGQEKHLGHELWHVVQQKQGRVKANYEFGGFKMNDERDLEAEADDYSMTLETLDSSKSRSIQTIAGWDDSVYQLVPKYLRYGRVGADAALEIEALRERQQNIFRNRPLHRRHIIPHSDLQTWMLHAATAGDANSPGGLFRRFVHELLVAMREGAWADTWEASYTDYEGAGAAGTFGQYDQDLVHTIWRLVEWHHGNIFFGHAGINEAIQNRFDGGAVAFYEPEYVNRLHDIWFRAGSAEGINPTPIRDMRIFSVALNDYIIARAAETDRSRPLLAARGHPQRLDL